MDVDALRALEPLCWRAPSAHNTQPWRLSYGLSAVGVGWDPADSLPAADPTGRDLRLSLGAFVETCLIVAADAGLAVAFEPHYSAVAHRVGWLRPAANRYPTAFDAASVLGRATHRGRYLAGPQPGSVAAVDAIAHAEGGAVRALDAADLARLTRTADRYLYADPAVVRELRSWLRLRRTHPRYHTDGLTDRCLGLSRVEAAGLRAALAAYPVLRPLGLPRALAAAGAAATDPLRAGEDVLVLIGPAGLDESGQVAFGRVLMRGWLTLSTAGLACHPLSQLIDAPATRAALAHRLDVAPERLLHVTRVGRPASAAPAARSARRVVAR